MPRRLILVLGLVGLQALALVVVLGITYWASQDVLLRYAEGLTARIARDATAYTEDFLDPANDAAVLSRRLIESGVVDTEDRAALTRYLFGLVKMRPNFDGTYYGDEAGEFVFVNRDTSMERSAFRVKDIVTEPERIVELSWVTEQFREVAGRTDPQDDYDPRTRPWYRQAQERGGLAWTAPYIFFTSQRPGITVAVPVDDPETLRFSGAVGVDIGIGALSAFLDGLDISPRGSAAIVAEAGDIIAHSQEELVATPDGQGGVRFGKVADGEDPILTGAAASIEGGLNGLFPGEIRVSRFEAAGETWLGAVQRLRLERTPWTVVTYLPQSDILSPLWRVRNTALWVAAGALLATALLGLVFGGVVMRRR
ncbi:cache domain-containing protein [Psychromarinibacter sp. C21-152]|uniref:Cache domain-containing protein n=1 Tax=Psychromarinibacter sediminicola TaxID=3033385 RepID=A0AAE3NXD3_9RHOB|nr:cache domain-containing protein [Psychromarinibacter sediminicola]MDF0602387.1 cache domain-containing protein [Psychromarinibacter sediminicola]